MNYALSFSRSAAEELKEYNKIKRAPSRVDQPNAQAGATQLGTLRGLGRGGAEGPRQRSLGRGWQPPRQRRPTLCSSFCGEMCVSCSVMSDSKTPLAVAHQPALFMEDSRQEHWSGLPLPSPGDLRDPGIKSRSPSFRQIVYPNEH